ncbi:MAG TPA: thylakoid-associated protein [Cyanobacteria bacterium UBA11149]|nr:thylakoid-associated protein [Cyanobacteria bacterium UBA11367]HBE60979.1 thylakoid-associated protein [Cyanobacteria bacterium UBA11366]HBK65875.1 thylakoid-associated protein [Cyanobacteria bacterium UBA11166]HBR72453.1 thylakoid-associated protein [Cyanobacteria bacterium UBA11159]HBS69400.1 thylakoid-associated protein [Cyanobacteria bacterium UBA11153]HBW90292.1 thylakoid-associated protein [Cyanobacteria bacterium UBA11149]HCA94221.1 thylakoid-associated protein [Cyanobacteria bacter
MANRNTTEAIEALAAEIGENIYIDVAKWHLYLREAHLHSILAQRLFPLVTEGNINQDEVVEILQSIPVKLGGGKRELPLVDLLPRQCEVNLMDLLEEFQRNL